MSRGASRKKLEEWRGRLERFEASGLSVAAFCELEKVSTASFYQWKKKLRTSTRSADRASDSGGFQALHVADVSASQNQTPQSQTVIQLGERVSIQLGNDLSVAELVVKQLLTATLDSGVSAGTKSC